MKTMYVFTGNNGSGKSTYRDLIKSKLDSKIDIDLDAIEKKMKEQGVLNYKKESGKEALRLFQELVGGEESFSTETTISSNVSIRQVKEAMRNGFYIVVYHLYLESVEYNLERIDLRVKNGGHFIPKEDVLRRDARVKRNVEKLKEMADELFLIDNSEREPIIKEIYKNGICIFNK